MVNAQTEDVMLCFGVGSRKHLRLVKSFILCRMSILFRFDIMGFTRATIDCFLNLMTSLSFSGETIVEAGLILS